MINTQNKACPETSTFLPFFVRITKVLPSTNQRHMGSSFAAFKVENNQTFGWFQIVDGACKIVQTFYFCFFFWEIFVWTQIGIKGVLFEGFMVPWPGQTCCDRGATRISMMPLLGVGFRQPNCRVCELWALNENAWQVFLNLWQDIQKKTLGGIWWRLPALAVIAVLPRFNQWNGLLATRKK